MQGFNARGWWCVILERGEGQNEMYTRGTFTSPSGVKFTSFFAVAKHIRRQPNVREELPDENDERGQKMAENEECSELVWPGLGLTWLGLT